MAQAPRPNLYDRLGSSLFHRSPPETQHAQSPDAVDENLSTSPFVITSVNSLERSDHSEPHRKLSTRTADLASNIRPPASPLFFQDSDNEDEPPPRTKLEDGEIDDVAQVTNRFSGTALGSPIKITLPYSISRSACKNTLALGSSSPEYVRKASPTKSSNSGTESNYLQDSKDRRFEKSSNAYRQLDQRNDHYSPPRNHYSAPRRASPAPPQGPRGVATHSNSLPLGKPRFPRYEEYIDVEAEKEDDHSHNSESEMLDVNYDRDVGPMKINAEREFLFKNEHLPSYPARAFELAAKTTNDKGAGGSNDACFMMFPGFGIMTKEMFKEWFNEAMQGSNLKQELEIQAQKQTSKPATPEKKKVTNVEENKSVSPKKKTSENAKIGRDMPSTPAVARKGSRTCTPGTETRTASTTKLKASKKSIREPSISSGSEDEPAFIRTRKRSYFDLRPEMSELEASRKQNATTTDVSTKTPDIHFRKRRKTEPAPSAHKSPEKPSRKRPAREESVSTPQRQKKDVTKKATAPTATPNATLPVDPITGIPNKYAFQRHYNRLVHATSSPKIHTKNRATFNRLMLAYYLGGNPRLTVSAISIHKQIRQIHPETCVVSLPKINEFSPFPPRGPGEVIIISTVFDLLGQLPDDHALDCKFPLFVEQETGCWEYMGTYMFEKVRQFNAVEAENFQKRSIIEETILRLFPGIRKRKMRLKGWSRSKCETMDDAMGEVGIDSLKKKLVPDVFKNVKELRKQGRNDIRKLLEQGTLKMDWVYLVPTAFDHDLHRKLCNAKWPLENSGRTWDDLPSRGPAR